MARRAYIRRMDSYDIGRLAYLVLLLTAVGGYFIANARGNLNKLAQQAAIWGLIFLGAVAGYGLWHDVRRDLAPRQAVVGSGQLEVPRQFDGHFYVTAAAGDTPLDFIVDTGATDVVLTREDAARAGIDLASLAYTGSATTANGIVRTARAHLDSFTLGTFTDRNVPVLVNEGEMDTSLLGMSYLRRFEKIEIAGDRLILTR